MFSSKRKMVAAGAGVGVLVVVGISILLFTSFNKKAAPSHPDAGTQINNVLVDAGLSTEAPAYYPAKLPAGYHFRPSSVRNNGAMLSYALDYSGGTLIVTQQPRPPLVEEVTKTKEFRTPIGRAYTASLNGHTVGFIATEKILIILSATNNVELADLEYLMTNFRPVQ